MSGLPTVWLSYWLFSPGANRACVRRSKTGRAWKAAAKAAQSAGDNAWMLVSAALVLMMTGPGLALVLRRPGPAAKTCSAR